MHRKRLRWNIIMVCFLLCIRISTEVQSDGENNSNTHVSNREEKPSNATGKVYTSSGTSNSTFGKVRRNNNTSNHVVHKPPNITDTKNDQEVSANVTIDGMSRGKGDSMNFGAVLRGFYVFLGLSVIVIMYFTVRAIRLGRKKTKVKKYGILANREDLEMTPLGADDDEDDTTVFDLSNHPGQ